MSRAVLLRCALGGVAVAAMSWLIGVQGARPLLLGACTFGVAAVVMITPTGHHGRWPHQPGVARGGGSTQVWRLANRIDSVTSHSRGTDAGLQQRLRTLAINRLAGHGVGWYDPRATEMLGADVYGALTAPEFSPSQRDLEHVVGAIENLDHRASGGSPA